MEFLNYEEQAIIKMYNFKTKEELKQKLARSLEETEDEFSKDIIKKLIPKIEAFSLEELKDVDNIFE